MTRKELEKRLAEIPEVEPDELDLQMLAEAEAEKNDPSMPLEDFYAAEERERKGGRISLRIPKSLHDELLESAKAEGVSLNQYILYHLSKVVGRSA